ncbi:hypothetical protein H6801_01115 [Candidatus Nomurabacteria bacterium]|nr:hypothetical protein [Candidatus Nomurabacteria bacterium]
MPTGRPSGENVFNIGAERLAPSIEYIKDVSAIHHEENKWPLSQSIIVVLVHRQKKPLQNK